MSPVGRRVSSPAFVGRSEQLAAVTAALDRADGGEAGAVFIGGEAGVGKTRLVAEFERIARSRGARVLAGACVDIGGSELPYAPLLGALRTLVRETQPRRLERLVGAGGGELGRLLPELQAGGARSEAVDPLAQARLFEALLDLFARTGVDGPVVLVIEDLHWADPSTRGFLSFLVRNIRRERLLLVATYRTDELHRRHPLRQVLGEVERLPAVERLEVPPFSRRELTQQLAAILEAPPEPALVEELFGRSQGNAFFAEELLAASGDGAAQPIPDSLRDALTLRVEQLSQPARRMVRSAAVAGPVLGHRLLAATSGMTERELLDALHESIEANVLVQDPASESYGFRHELLREALYDELLPRERVALHASLARSLEDEPGLAVGAHGASAQRAMHWSAAHELGHALGASVEAGFEAERVWSFAEANGHFERAIELWERVPPEQRPAGASLVDLLDRAAEAAYLSGLSPRAVTLTRSALEAIDPEREPAAAGLAHERLGRYLLADYLRAEALEEYRAAAALVPAEPTAARASILAGEAHILMLEGEPVQARAPCEEAVRIARKVGAARVECDALNTLGAVLAILGAPEDGIQVLRRGKQLAEELGALQELRRAYINLGQSLDHAGRLDEAAEVAREGWERLRPRIGGTAAAFLAAEAGGRLRRLGDWEEALAILGEARDTARPDWTTGLVLAELAVLQALRGEFERSGASLEALVELRPKGNPYWPSAEANAAAALAWARGDPPEVRHVVDLDSPIWQSDPAFDIPRFAYALSAEADVALRARAAGDEAAERDAATRALALLDRVHALTAPDNRPLGHTPPDLLLEVELCELEAGRARGDTNPATWAALASRWQGLGRPFQAAYALLREADAALAENLPRARIAETLGCARATATRLGARPLLDQIETVSRRARLRAAPQGAAMPEEVAGLTTRELDVLRLIAAGHTNPEIGKALYMSPKTASVHVSRILAKLDVKTRTEAAGVAHRLGLLDVG